MPEFPQGQADKLGRIAFGKMDLFANPDGTGQPIGALFEDNLVVWVREVLGSMPGRVNQRFVGTGVAIHSTYWHNNYGKPSSRGCVNASPEDAKWIFRWSLPQVPYDPGDITLEWPDGTKVIVEDKVL